MSGPKFSYGTGTISADGESATVTGTGTAFTTQVKVGDEIAELIDGRFTPIGLVDEVVSDAEITLQDEYTGSAITDAPYRISRGIAWLSGAAANETFVKFATLLGPRGLGGFVEGTPNAADWRDNDFVASGNGIVYQRRAGQMVPVAGIAFDPEHTAFGDSIGDRDQYDGEAQNFIFFLVDGEDSGFYVLLTPEDGEESAVWTDKIPFRGPQGDPGASDVVGTSASSVEIGTGAKQFTIQEDERGWGVGARLRISSDASPAVNFMEGVATAYAGNTLDVTVDLIGGSGTLSDWTINIAGEEGAAGQDGASSADAVSFDPSGLSNTDATDVQEALADHDGVLDGKAAISGQTFTGNVAVNPGTAGVASRLDVNAENANSTLSVAIAIDSAAAGRMDFQKNRGTLASPTVAQIGDNLMDLAAKARASAGGGGMYAAAVIQATLGDDDVTTSGHPSSGIKFQSRGSGDTGFNVITFDLITMSHDGEVRPVNIGTTGDPANAFLDGSDNNNLLRSTSSLTFKKDVEPVDAQKVAAFFAGASPIWYRSLAKADKLADGSEKSFYSFGAEPLSEIDPRLVTWGYRPDDYERVQTGEQESETGKILRHEEVEQTYDTGRKDEDGKPILRKQVVKRPVYETVTEPTYARRLKEDAVLKPDGVNDRAIIAMLVCEVKRLRDEVAGLKADRGNS